MPALLYHHRLAALYIPARSIACPGRTAPRSDKQNEALQPVHIVAAQSQGRLWRLRERNRFSRAAQFLDPRFGIGLSADKRTAYHQLFFLRRDQEQERTVSSLTILAALQLRSAYAADKANECRPFQGLHLVPALTPGKANSCAIRVTQVPVPYLFFYGVQPLSFTI